MNKVQLHKQFTFLSDPKGGVAIISLVLVSAVALFVVLAFLDLSLTEVKVNRNYKIDSKTFYATEGGLEDALLRYKKEPDNFSTSTLEFSGVSIDFNLTTSTLYSDFEAQGNYRRGQTTLHANCSLSDWWCIESRIE